MENILVLKKTRISNDFVKSQFHEKLLMPELTRINPVLEDIRMEAGVDFVQYLHWLELANEPDLVTLSSTHHYYYDSNDLKSIKTLINLKKLNNIKHLERFLRIVVRILPQKSNFVGYFKSSNPNRSVFSLYQSFKFFNGIVNYIDSRIDRSLTRENVSRLLEEHKLKIVDITDINGMTYFCSYKTGKSI